jgi:hypothetical protein
MPAAHATAGSEFSLSSDVTARLWKDLSLSRGYLRSTHATSELQPFDSSPALSPFLCSPLHIIGLQFFSLDRQEPAKMSIDFPKEEERILAFWNSINAFHRQLELSKGKKPYTFYDGPPFDTGMPHVRC